MKVILLLVATLLVTANATISGITSTINGFTFSSTAASTALVSVKYPGMTAAAGPGFNVTSTGSAGALTVTVSQLNSGNYWIADDGATWKNASTSCTADAAIVLNTASSGTTTISGALVLRLVFTEQFKYNSISYKYSNTNGAINCNSTRSVGSPLQSWVRTTPTPSACNGQIMTYQQDFNNALQSCGFTRDETSAQFTIFSASIIITTTDNGDVIRGTRYARTLDTSVTIKIAFQTNITAQTTNLVYGSGITDATLASQSWDSNATLAKLVLLTSVQYPYILRLPTRTGGTWFGGVTGTFNIIAYTNDPSTDKLGNAVSSDRSMCTTGTPASAAGVGAVCWQFWNITYGLGQWCNTTTTSLELDSSHTVQFTFSCSGNFNGSCSTPSPATTTVSFSVASDNYCPVLISTQAASATLTTYQDSSFSVAQTSFVFGSYSYFEAKVTSPIVLDYVGIETVTMSSGGSATLSNQNVYTRAFTTAATWFAGGAGTYATNSVGSVSVADTLSTSPNMVVQDNNGTTLNGGLTKSARFQWRWCSVISSASGDNPTTTTVSVALRLRFKNQTAVELPEHLKVFKQYAILDDSSAAASAQAEVLAATVVPTTTTTTTAAGSSTSTVGLALSVVGIAAGVLGVVALVAVFTTYMLKQQRERSKEQLASVQLSSTTNLNASV